MKILKWCSGIALTLFLVPVLFVVGVNSSDPAQFDEVTKILDRPHPVLKPEQVKAYGFVEKLALENGSGGWPSDFGPCGDLEEDCSVDLIDRHPEILEKLKDNAKVVADYVTLVTMGEGGYPSPSSIEDSFRDVDMVPSDVHVAFTLQLAVWLKAGGEARVFDLIEASNNYLVYFFKHGSFGDRINALANMELNARFLLAEIKRSPKLRLRTSLVESFVAPDIDELITGAMEEELKLLNSISQSWSLLSEMSPWGPFAALAFKKNETLNKYFEIANQQIASECPEIVEANLQVCAPKMLWLYPEGFLNRIRNATGRHLILSMDLDLASQREFMEEQAMEILRIKKALALNI